MLCTVLQSVLLPLSSTVHDATTVSQIDDGLELRKAAFECLDILLDSCPDTLDRPTFLHHLELGLTDHYDVKMPAHLMLSKLASSSGGAVSAQLEGLINPLEKTLTARLKSDSVKQEVGGCLCYCYIPNLLMPGMLQSSRLVSVRDPSLALADWLIIAGGHAVQGAMSL